MIIKSLRIKNFRSYYGDNEFKFSDGLTLIIGDNGDGKTTFFEALEWLFNTSFENKESTNISEMKKSELAIGDSDTLCVSIVFEHDGEKELIKSFTFEKIDENSFKPRDFSFNGYETIGSERSLISGKELIDRCFDSFIRKYCLFKGESQLNVFDDPTALKTLVDKFSDIRKFEKYVNVTTELEKKSDEAYKKECRLDKKISQQAEILEQQLLELNTEIFNLRKDLRKQEEVASSYKIKLEDLEKNQETSEKYQDIMNRIKTLSEKRTKFKGMILENFNAQLLENFWILAPYPSIFEEFQKKVSSFGKEKRSQHEKYIAQQAATEAKREVIDQITTFANAKCQLPWDLPDKETMQEMLDDEICKVCGREAKKGSEAYKFMYSKLQQYLQHMEQKAAESVVEESKKKTLFINKYIDELRTMSISFGGTTAEDIVKKKTEIIDRFEFIGARKIDIEKLDKEIQELEDEKSRLLIQADGISEELLEKDFKDIKGFFEQEGRAKSRINEYQNKLDLSEQQKAELEKEFSNLDPTTNIAKIYNKVHILLSKVMEAFANAKEENLRRFLALLETRANYYLDKLNANDFRGIIRINSTINESAEIKLFSSNGTYICDPGGAQETTMYMSVLFAISDITTIKREEDYPLIFDAPTSSFGAFKENVFYNIIDKIKKQCIIVTKDLLEVDKITGIKRLNEDKINELTCKVYRIEKQEDYEPTDLSTIRTIIKPIK
jgi:DNA sulfur modification protein DndD